MMDEIYGPSTRGTRSYSLTNASICLVRARLCAIWVMLLDLIGGPPNVIKENSREDNKLCVIIWHDKKNSRLTIINLSTNVTNRVAATAPPAEWPVPFHELHTMFLKSSDGHLQIMGENQFYIEMNTCPSSSIHTKSAVKHLKISPRGR